MPHVLHLVNWWKLSIHVLVHVAVNLLLVAILHGLDLMLLLKILLVWRLLLVNAIGELHTVHLWRWHLLLEISLWHHARVHHVVHCRWHHSWWLHHSWWRHHVHLRWRHHSTCGHLRHAISSLHLLHSLRTHHLSSHVHHCRTTSWSHLLHHLRHHALHSTTWYLPVLHHCHHLCSHKLHLSWVWTHCLWCKSLYSLTLFRKRPRLIQWVQLKHI